MRFRQDAPDEIWDAALECVSGGGGTPTFYCEENFIRSFDECGLGISPEDKYNFAFSGCSETVIDGCTNPGATEIYWNALTGLEKIMYEELENCAGFEEFLEKYKNYLKEEIYNVAHDMNLLIEHKQKYWANLVRSLFINDCIENGRDFNAGGARYNWVISNLMGIAEVVDSLTALRIFIFEKQEMPKAEFLDALRNNFETAPMLREKLLALPKAGNDIKEVNELAHDVSSFIFQEFLKYASRRGGRLIPMISMWIAYTENGVYVGATPDGRLSGAPLSDSIGAYQGRDKNGPTSLLASAACMDLEHVPGTPIVNIRFSTKMVTDKAAREKIKALIKTYFKNGGMQVQLNVLDNERIKLAIENPEEYGNTIIRVGGYSDYFKNLPLALKQTFLERTEY
jgi:formate C-acetyltransferase